MKKGQIIGLLLLITGILLIYLYSAIQALQNINIASVPVAIIIGIIAIILGGIYLLMSIIFEQKKDMKKRKEEIPKEDFEP
jgi:hypothetical protein